MYDIVKYANRDEWLEGRKLGIGSSDVGIILGLNKYSTPLRLWLKRTGRTAPEAENAAMSRGHRMEVVVANDFAAATGAVIDNNSVDDWHAVDRDRPFLRVSPDRLWWPEGTPEGERTTESALILECKTCTADVTPETVFDAFPYWYAQVQYQMGVMGVGRCALAWINVGTPNLPFGYTFVDFDAKYYGGVMVPALEKFWNENIVGGAMPETITDDEDAIIRYRKAEEGSKSVASEQVVARIARCKAVEEQIKTLEKEADDIKLEVKTAMGEAETLVAPDGKTVVATWKNCSVAGRFDSKRFKEENPETYEKYMSGGGETRRLTLRAPKAA